MKTTILSAIKQIFTFRWKPNQDLWIVALSWILVVASLSMATFVVGRQVWGGMGYFLMYAVVGATLFGVGLPIYWMLVVRKRTLADLGITFKHWKISLILQLVLTLIVNLPRLLQMGFPAFNEFLPLIFMALAIGFFEAIFWRGWVQLRLEEAFGVLPAIVVAALLYAVYHIGYGMPVSQIGFLFIIGLMFAVVFRTTGSILILWPLFQPSGQLITLVMDKLSLPLMASVGFLETFGLMVLVIWLGNKYHRKQRKTVTVPAD